MSGHIDQVDQQTSEAMHEHLISSGEDVALIAKASDAEIVARLDEGYAGGAWAFVEDHGGEVTVIQVVRP